MNTKYKQIIAYYQKHHENKTNEEIGKHLQCSGEYARRLVIKETQRRVEILKAFKEYEDGVDVMDLLDKYIN